MNNPVNSPMSSMLIWNHLPTDRMEEETPLNISEPAIKEEVKAEGGDFG